MTQAKRTILVSGATGKQGGAVARCLLQRNWTVRILTRDPSRPAANELARQGAEVFQGDMEDVDSLARAMEGCYGAFSVQDYYQAGEKGEIRQGRNFAAAAKDAEVTHFVYSSVGSAHRNTGIPHFETKWRVEQYIHELQLPHTIIRPVFFMDNFWTYQKDSVLKGTLSLPLPPDRRLQMVAVSDIGACAARCFEQPDRFIGQAFDLAGDELTMMEAARQIGQAIGREVQYVPTPLEPMWKSAPDLARMYQWFDKVGYNVDIPILRRACSLMDFGSYLRQSEWAHLPQTV